MISAALQASLSCPTARCPGAGPACPAAPSSRYAVIGSARRCQTRRGSIQAAASGSGGGGGSSDASASESAEAAFAAAQSCMDLFLSRRRSSDLDAVINYL